MEHLVMLGLVPIIIILALIGLFVLPLVILAKIGNLGRRLDRQVETFGLNHSADRPRVVDAAVERR